MGVGAFMEPLVVVTLLFGGTWINRDSGYRVFNARKGRWSPGDMPPSGRDDSPDSIKSGLLSPRDALLGGFPRSSSPSLLSHQESPWRTREIGLFGYKKEIASPNTKVFQGRFLSRTLQKFPFLVECWYWALVYWIYQIGRAFTALTLKEDTVDVAREHALWLIHTEEKLHIFWETGIQGFFMQHPFFMLWINRLYSFIHIPGTILFLVWLFYYTNTCNRVRGYRGERLAGDIDGSPAGPKLYEARRRTLAMCNLIAFIVFTIWPCMPPRLLSDKEVKGPVGEEARKYGFVDTVHGAGGEASVWTQNRFCNQYAAMPSLHFGYALMIGLTIMTIPLPPQHRHSKSLSLPFVKRTNSSVAPRLRLPSLRRMICVIVGFLYPATILIAIVATANHFILDAIAGSLVCGLAWHGNPALLNLLPIEDYFLWCLRMHKPEGIIVDVLEGDDEEGGEWVVGKGVSYD
ncbi:MAG: hypothetical protein M1819_002856 [Sarea resinae]|nr:MAG: hypothetical protein M1819_002856 [Sarea resinae]